MKNQADRLRYFVHDLLTKVGLKEEIKPLSVAVITELEPKNCLSSTSRLININTDSGIVPHSVEGFSGNVERQQELADFLYDHILSNKSGAFIDIGFGSNIHVSNRIASKGVETYAIDQISGDSDERDIWQPPSYVRTNSENVAICGGDIARIGEEDSVLKDKKFGLAVFNGSWSSSGNNWTVSGEVMEARYHTESRRDTSMIQFMDKKKDAILKSVVDQLDEGGSIGIISSRYAFHGAGYDFSHLPEEKMVMYDAVERLSRLGARKITLVGMTRDGLRSTVESTMNYYAQKTLEVDQSGVETVVSTLNETELLPIEDVYSRYGDDESYQLRRNRAVKQFALDRPELQQLARIDAVFAEF